MYLAGGKLFPAGTAEQDVAGAGDTFRMIGLAWAGVAALLVVLFAALRARAARRAEIVATGIPGTATVTTSRSSGTSCRCRARSRWRPTPRTVTLGGSAKALPLLRRAGPALLPAPRYAGFADIAQIAIP
jgi:hypothetical protein